MSMAVQDPTPVAPTRVPANGADVRHPVHSPVFIPDLLHPTPTSRVDLETTKLSIALAFASGVAGGLFGDVLDRATMAPSTWEPASFASDLFLQNFVATCFKIRIGNDEPVLSTTHLVK